MTRYGPNWELPWDESNWRPEIVCLCGSTRFADTFNAENLRLTLEGKIVLSIGANVSDAALGISQESEIKRRLDDLHLAKIDLADRVHVLNVDGYIGESTLREIQHARRHLKRITYLEALRPGSPALLPEARDE